MAGAINPEQSARPAQSSLWQRIAGEINTNGPIPFSRFMELALYDGDNGFYSAGGQAGRRRGDFITSVEVGPLFGAVIARSLDEQWRAVGEPAEFRVAEAGAGVGTLYRTIHRAQPACLQALTYTLVEQSEQLRAEHEGLPKAAWRSSATLPDEQQHLILANELLDNLPFDIAERQENGWAELRVDFCPEPATKFDFVSVEAHPAADLLDAVAPQAPIGAHVPVMTAASAWIATARSRADRVLAFDYGATTKELVGRGRNGWLRTYRQQTRGADPLADPGVFDITADVAWDQLDADIAVCTQAEWLHRAGIDDLVAQARTTWSERAAIGDLQAMIARSAINEAEALTEPEGLGGFLVFEWPGHAVTRTENGRSVL